MDYHQLAAVPLDLPWPLIAVRLAEGRTAEAIDASLQLLVPPQQRLPDELEAAVEAAGEAWDQGDHQLAGATWARPSSWRCNCATSEPTKAQEAKRNISLFAEPSEC